MTNKICSYRPLLPRQNIISDNLVSEILIESINQNAFLFMKNQTYEFIVLNYKPIACYIFNIKHNKNGLYGHSSFPQINDTQYNNELIDDTIKLHQVKYAGRIAFDFEGRLEYWNNSSGHYKPHIDDAYNIGINKNKFKKHIGVMTWAKIASGHK